MIYIDISSLKGHRYWFWDVSFFSDWSDKQCDYATNAVVHNFYNEKEAKWYRANKYNRFVKLESYYIPEEVALKLLKGDTVTVGLDRYALMNISNSLIPPNILKDNAVELYENYKVITFKLFVVDSLLIWRKNGLVTG